MNVTRRNVIKAGGLVTGGALLGAAAPRLAGQAGRDQVETQKPADYPLAHAENVLYSACLQCNTQCTVKAKFQDGLLVKLDGNPYSPMTLQPQLPYATTLGDAVRVDGPLCPKGQSGVQSLYDPYRLRKVLKRVGARGSGKWKVISFDQAVKELVDGGQLFAQDGETRHVAGFKDVFALTDAKLSKTMAKDVDAVRAGKSTVAQFKAKHAAHLDVLIDPDHPDLGPKNNQFVFQGGRISPDRETYAKRFTFGGIGSANWYAHTTICEQAHHVAFQLTTSQWTQQKDGTWAWVAGTNHMKPDYTQSEFVIFWGTGFAEANFGPTPLGPKVTQSIVDKGLKVAVVDPRLSKSAAKGWWIPVKPAGDLALAMGMIGWIIDNQRYDTGFLRNANQAAATANGESSWSNASWLVRSDNGKLLRADTAGVGTPDQFVALVAGHPVAVNPNDAKTPVVGDLDAATTVKGVPVSTGFRLLKLSAKEHDLNFYATESGIDPTTIQELAQEFTAHGKKAAIDFYRGPIKVTYGYYSAQAIIALNFLIGNVDHVGGLVPGGGTWDPMGAKTGQPFDLTKLHTGALTPFGVKLTREASGPYQTSTIFARDGYPAKRPWFPYTSDVYQEIIPAAYAGYPYPIKILWLHYGTPVLSTPAGHLQIQMLQDTDKIPLFIATDVVVGETSMYADYVFPDISYLERWGNPQGTSPVTLTKISKVRQPVAAPIPEIVTVDGEAMPASMDALMIAIAKGLGVPGYGKDGFAPGVPFDRPEDFYLKQVANVAWGEKPGDTVPDASAAEVASLSASRRHLPAAVFDEAKWAAAVGPQHWARVVTVLNRGGRFEAADKAYAGAMVKHSWGKLLDLYVESVGSGLHSVTAQRFSGVPVFERLKNFNGTEVAFPADFDLTLFTYKEIFGGQSRTAGNYAGQMSLMPENFVYLNAVDGKRLSLADGDVVEMHSVGFKGTFDVGAGQTRDVRGSVKIVQGLRPGSVSVSWHYGHWAYGSRPIEIDGETIAGEAARGRGLCPNPAMAIDEYLKDLCLSDPIAGDSAFGGSKVKLVKVGNQGSAVVTAMPAAGYYSHGPQAHLPQPTDPQTQKWLSEYASSPRGTAAADAQVKTAAIRRWRGSQASTPPKITNS
jgi:anaerobic selenocysteine-containing dehydrogenase